MAELVSMWRSEEDAKGGPTTAAVHPEEVAQYRAGGWRSDAPPAMDEAPEADEPDTADAPAKRGRKPKA